MFTYHWKLKKKLYQKYTQKPWCTPCNVSWSFWSLTNQFKCFAVSNQGPSNRYYQDESNVWYLESVSLRHSHISLFFVCPKKNRLGHLRQLCATLYGWHWCTLCHQGLAKRGGVEVGRTCGLGKSNYKCRESLLHSRESIRTRSKGRNLVPVLQWIIWSNTEKQRVTCTVNIVFRKCIGIKQAWYWILA